MIWKIDLNWIVTSVHVIELKNVVEAFDNWPWKKFIKLIDELNLFVWRIHDLNDFIMNIKIARIAKSAKSALHYKQNELKW